jgi:WD40 repeat protein
MSGFAFISHAREDRDYVARLSAFLTDAGIATWDGSAVADGPDAEQTSRSKIEECDAFIVVMSPAARESAAVLDELDLALDLHKEVLPILLSGDRLFGIGRRPVELLTGGEMPTARFVADLRGLLGDGDGLRHELKAHEGHVVSVAFPAREPSLVASADTHKGVRIWDPRTGELKLELPEAKGPVSFTRYGDQIATAGADHAVSLWDTRTGELIKQVGEHGAPLLSIALAQDGRYLVTGAGGHDRSERIWDVATGELLQTLRGRVAPASPLVLAEDGTWLVAPTEPRFQRGAALWQVPSGALIGTLGGHQGEVHDVTISWDGRYVATAGADGTARVWDARTGDELQVLSGHTKPVRSVAFSPSGYRLATGSTDETIRLWDAATGAPIRRITSRAGGIYDLAYSPDGQILASGHGDGALRLWNV